MSLKSIVANNVHLKKIITVAILVGLIVIIYGRVSSYEFINYDDSIYISLSSRSISFDSICWAFTAMDFANWHPLTWLSLMLDYNIYEANAGGYHLTNLFFHIAGSLLLLFLFNKMTGSFYSSAFVTALFALHPSHVESVAWVSERKDVLSAIFMFLTMWAYVVYADKARLSQYLLVVISFIFGLMAKPMLVTLPFILLLMDYWPLGRMNFGQDIPVINKALEKKSIGQLIWEKIPLFLCSICSSVVTVIAQNKSNAIVSLEYYPIGTRLLNALNSYSSYLQNTFWFDGLGVFYLYSRIFNCWQIGSAFLLICSITILALIWIKNKPYLAIGWFWYLGMLVPVIGLVQVGFQAMADRYTYLPLIGIFIGISWGVPDLISKIRYSKILLFLSAIFFIFLIVMATDTQVKVWRNNYTLSEHALKLNPQNYFAYNMIGLAMDKENNHEKALYNFYMAIHIKPKFEPAYINAANVLLKQGMLDQAIGNYKKALQINNKSADAHYNLGRALIFKNNFHEAVFHLNLSLQIMPNDADTHNNLGVALNKIGKNQEAIVHFRKALQLKPQISEFQRNLLIVLDREKTTNRSIATEE